jgi:hypothetical protein
MPKMVIHMKSQSSNLPSSNLPSSSSGQGILSGSGIPVTDKKFLVGSWTEIDQKNYTGGLTQTRNFSTSGPDSYIFVFDIINIRLTHGGSTIYSGQWDFKDGVITMTDGKPNSRPIIYSDLRFKDGRLTAIYKDRDIIQILTWQKIGN